MIMLQPHLPKRLLVNCLLSIVKFLPCQDIQTVLSKLALHCVITIADPPQAH